MTVDDHVHKTIIKKITQHYHTISLENIHWEHSNDTKNNYVCWLNKQLSSSTPMF